MIEGKPAGLNDRPAGSIDRLAGAPAMSSLPCPSRQRHSGCIAAAAGATALLAEASRSVFARILRRVSGDDDAGQLARGPDMNGGAEVELGVERAALDADRLA